MTYPSKPSNIPSPITKADEDGDWNIKPRLVCCKHCKYSVETSLPGPICGKCNSFLITVVVNELVE